MPVHLLTTSLRKQLLNNHEGDSSIKVNAPGQLRYRDAAFPSFACLDCPSLTIARPSGTFFRCTEASCSFFTVSLRQTSLSVVRFPKRESMSLCAKLADVIMSRRSCACSFLISLLSTFFFPADVCTVRKLHEHVQSVLLAAHPHVQNPYDMFTVNATAVYLG